MPPSHAQSPRFNFSLRYFFKWDFLIYLFIFKQGPRELECCWSEDPILSISNILHFTVSRTVWVLWNSALAGGGGGNMCRKPGLPQALSTSHLVPCPRGLDNLLFLWEEPHFGRKQSSLDRGNCHSEIWGKSKEEVKDAGDCFQVAQIFR